MKEIIQYKTHGTCSKIIEAVIEDNRVCEVRFAGGCNGNLKGIAALVKGMDIDDVIERLGGIRCGDKVTSCPDQFAKCLIEYKARQAVASQS